MYYENDLSRFPTVTLKDGHTILMDYEAFNDLMESAFQYQRRRYEREAILRLLRKRFGPYSPYLKDEGTVGAMLEYVDANRDDSMSMDELRQRAFEMVLGGDTK